MKDRVTELLDKYWIGETSLQEEAELKSLLKETDAFPELTEFFSGVEKLAKIDPGAVFISKRKNPLNAFFWKIAAVFIGFLLVGGLVYSDYHRREQEKAYLQVMEAFALIQSNLEKGSKELHVLGELRHLSNAHELFNRNELNEQ